MATTQTKYRLLREALTALADDLRTTGHGTIADRIEYCMEDADEDRYVRPDPVADLSTYEDKYGET